MALSLPSPAPSCTAAECLQHKAMVVVRKHQKDDMRVCVSDVTSHKRHTRITIVIRLNSGKLTRSGLQED